MVLQPAPTRTGEHGVLEDPSREPDQRDAGPLPDEQGRLGDRGGGRVVEGGAHRTRPEPRRARRRRPPEARAPGRGRGRRPRRGCRSATAPGSPRPPPTSASSSIAACPSYVASWQTPASAATASNSRPMLVVGMQPAPRSSIRPTTRRSVSSAAATAGSRSSQGQPGGVQVGQRGAGRPAGRGVAAGEGHGGQVSHALGRGVAAEQHLAAPDRAVRAVPGAVEGEAQHGDVGRHPVLRE